MASSDGLVPRRPSYRLSVRRAVFVIGACALAACVAQVYAQDAVSDMQSTHTKLPPWARAENARALAARSGARLTSAAVNRTSIAGTNIDDTPQFNNDKPQVNELLSPQGVAIDPVERRLYVTDTARQSVFEETREGGLRKVGSGFMV